MIYFVSMIILSYFSVQMVIEKLMLFHLYIMLFGYINKHLLTISKLRQDYRILILYHNIYYYNLHKFI